MNQKDIEKIYIVYVAGPYRADSEWGIRKNIEKCANRAMEVWETAKGGWPRAVAVTPCMNTSFFGGTVPDSVWLDGYLSLLLRCDAIIMADGWENSSGSLAEIRFAEENNIPVFYSTDDLVHWMDEKDSKLGIKR